MLFCTVVKPQLGCIACAPKRYAMLFVDPFHNFTCVHSLYLGCAQIMGTFRAKLYRFKKDEMGWGDMGVGLLRLMKHTATDARRLVLRNDMGKVGRVL